MSEGFVKPIFFRFVATGAPLASRLAPLSPAVLLLPLLPPTSPSPFVTTIVTSVIVTSVTLLPLPAPVHGGAGKADSDAGVGLQLVGAGAVVGGGLARAVVLQLDLDVCLAGHDLHVAPRHVRLAVRAAHRPLVLAPLARAETLARATPGEVGSVAGPLAGHLDARGAVAGGQTQVAAGLVRDAVRAAHPALPLAAPADVGAGAGAQRHALHVLHTHLELGTGHLHAGAT